MGRTSHMDESKVVIQMKDIVKKFGDFTANDHINLTVHKGDGSRDPGRERSRKEYNDERTLWTLQTD